MDKDRRTECKINPNWGNQNYPLAEGKYHHIIKSSYQGKNKYILLIHLAYDIFKLGDFCGDKDSWWFKKVRDGAKSNKGPDATCETPLQMLYYFDEDYCIVDLTKDLKTDQKNKEYVSIFHNFVIIVMNI